MYYNKYFIYFNTFYDYLFYTRRAYNAPTAQAQNKRRRMAF